MACVRCSLRTLDIFDSRFHSPDYCPVSLYRITRKPLQLSSGPKLPAGTIICVDIHHVNNSATLFPSPDIYDPYRFLKKREQPGSEHRFQFVSTGAADPNWGDGTQACPGRFFANSTLKVCLAHVLLFYDIKLPNGQERPQLTCLPNGSYAPDMAAKISFQSRK